MKEAIPKLPVRYRTVERQFQTRHCHRKAATMSGPILNQCTAYNNISAGRMISYTVMACRIGMVWNNGIVASMWKKTVAWESSSIGRQKPRNSHLVF